MEFIKCTADQFQEAYNQFIDVVVDREVQDACYGERLVGDICCKYPLPKTL